jgi:hypothetical protein
MRRGPTLRSDASSEAIATTPDVNEQRLITMNTTGQAIPDRRSRHALSENIVDGAINVPQVHIAAAASQDLHDRPFNRARLQTDRVAALSCAIAIGRRSRLP